MTGHPTYTSRRDGATSFTTSILSLQFPTSVMLLIAAMLGAVIFGLASLIVKHVMARSSHQNSNPVPLFPRSTIHGLPQGAHEAWSYCPCRAKAAFVQRCRGLQGHLWPRLPSSQRGILRSSCWIASASRRRIRPRQPLPEAPSACRGLFAGQLGELRIHRGRENKCSPQPV